MFSKRRFPRNPEFQQPYSVGLLSLLRFLTFAKHNLSIKVRNQPCGVDCAAG